MIRFMPKPRTGSDLTKFINPSQIGGIDAYAIDEGPARGVRALCVNTGGGLRFRVLVDRGMDVDQAFFNQHSLVYLTHRGVTPPTRGLDRGQDWLKSFPGGLLTSCGPFNIGSDTTDEGEVLGLHGPHSTTGAEIESVVQPDPRNGRSAMSITGIVRYGGMYGPNVELRRTISSSLGSNAIDFADEFFNAGHIDVPHAWLLHCNFGYPLVDEGSEICWDSPRIEPMAGHEPSAQFFRKGVNFKRLSGPLASHRGAGCVVGYAYPRAADRSGRTTVGLVNRKLNLGVAIRYSTKEFPRCGNWQKLAPYEYVCAIEPMNGTVEGRDKDRARGLMDTLKAGQRKTYRYQMEVVSDRAGVESLRRLNG